MGPDSNRMDLPNTVKPQGLSEVPRVGYHDITDTTSHSIMLVSAVERQNTMVSLVLVLRRSLLRSLIGGPSAYLLHGIPARGP